MYPVAPVTRTRGRGSARKGCTDTNVDRDDGVHLIAELVPRSLCWLDVAGAISGASADANVAGCCWTPVIFEARPCQRSLAVEQARWRPGVLVVEADVDTRDRPVRGPGETE